MSINQNPQFTILLIVTVVLGATRAEMPPAEPIFAVHSWSCSPGWLGEFTRALARTPDGYLWIETPEGLMRFDGMRSVILTIDTVPALGDNRIRSLVVDREGVLWIGTQGGTLSRRRAGEFESIPLDPRLREVSIESLTVADGGGVWLGTEQWGMVKVEDGECDFSATTPPLPPQAARSLVQLSDGEWWAKTRQSLVKIDHGNWHLEGLGLDPNTRFHALAPDREGTGLWVATGTAPGEQGGTRVFKVEGGRVVRELTPYPWPQDTGASNSTRIIEDGEGRLWVATYQRGVYYWQPEYGWRELVSGDGHSFMQPTGFYADSEGLLWMTTNDMKLQRIMTQKVATVLLPAEHRNEIITGVCIRRDDTLWAGTEHAGVFRFQDRRLLQVTDGLPSLNVNVLLEDSRANLWVGTRRGLARWSGERFQPVSVGASPGVVFAMCEDRHGNVWAGNGPQVVQLRPDGQSRVFGVESGLSDSVVRGLAETTDGGIYVTQYTSLLFRLNGDRFEVFKDFRPTVDRCIDLLPDEDGGLWILSDGEGLGRLYQGEFRRWSNAQGDGVPGDYLRSIMPDSEGNLWFSSSTLGILGCSKGALLGYQHGVTPPVLFWRLGEADGLLGGWMFGPGQPTAARSADGRLWFPNQSAVAVIDPQVVTHHPPSFHPLIEEVIADGAVCPREPDGTLRLLSGTRHLQICYTCADLESPEDQQFRYRLDGLEDQWIKAGSERVARYLDLAPGDYSFRLMVGRESGQWIECKAPLVLSIVPRWWERASVRIGGGITILGAVVFVVWRIAHSRLQRRLADLEQQHLLEQEREQARLILEKSEERYRTIFERSKNGIIFTDIHTFKFKYANPAATQLLGYTEAELCSLGVEDIYPPEVLDDVYRRFEAQRKGERIDAFDFPVVRKDGSILYVELSSSAFSTSEGKYSIAFFNDVTQRKKALDAFRNSEQLARLLLNATTDVSHLIDQDGTILDLNDAMAARLGATREELIGTCVFDRFPREVAEARKELFRQANLEGKPLRFIDRARPNVVFDVGVYPIATPAGGKRQFVVFAHDITERENILKSLKLSEERLKEAQRIARIGNWELDLLTDTLTWSDEIIRIFEIGKEQFGTSYEFFLSTVHPEDREAVNTAYMQSLETRKPYVITHRLLMPDGRIKYVLEQCETMYSPEGKPLRSIGTVQDITERTESALAIMEAERRYRTIANFTYDWEYWEGPDNEILYMSPSCERVTGYDRDDFVANPGLLNDIIIPEDKNIWATHRYEVKDKNKSLEIQFRIITKDGSIRWMEHVCQPVFDENSEFQGVRVSNRDVTERKMSEESLQKSQKSLQYLAGRLITIQEDEHRRLAREMHDDLTQRLALLAIEVRRLEIENQQHGSPIYAYLQGIREKINKLSKDIHDISRQIHPAIIDDLGLVDAIRSECDAFSEREEIQMAYDTKNVPSFISKDVAICIYRITQEGLRNIAKHAETDKASVSLIGHDGNLVLTIRDTGIGFDTTHGKGQKGIGLTSIRERVRLINGELSLKSKPGAGTVIKVIVHCTEERE